jgi:hypothetical protein
MKNLYLLLLLFPLGIMAQIEETKSDSIAVQIKDTKPNQEYAATTPKCIAGDCKNGQGTMNYKSGTYKGSWKNGLRYGQGKFSWINGDIYNGSWFEDKRHGQGTYTWSDGSIYKGHYSHGVRSGYGIYYYTNGTIYEGTWQSNLKHGIANFYFKESVNIGGRYFNNEYVSGTGINQESYKHKPE